MLIASTSSVYMIDRDNAVYCVPKIVFPKRKDPSASIADTLLDGVSSAYMLQLVYDKFLLHCNSILVPYHLAFVVDCVHKR